MYKVEHYKNIIYVGFIAIPNVEFYLYYVHRGLTKENNQLNIKNLL